MLVLFIQAHKEIGETPAWDLCFVASNVIFLESLTIAGLRMSTGRGLITAWCLIDFEYHLKAEKASGQQIITGDKGEDEIKIVLKFQT